MSQTTLHLLSASPSNDCHVQCLRALLPGDALLLLGDGVYAACEGTGHADRLCALPDSIAIHVLDEDCMARGISGRVTQLVHEIDYPLFVALACRHARSVSWF